MSGTSMALDRGMTRHAICWSWLAHEGVVSRGSWGTLVSNQLGLEAVRDMRTREKRGVGDFMDGSGGWMTMSAKVSEGLLGRF